MLQIEIIAEVLSDLIYLIGSYIIKATRMGPRLVDRVISMGYSLIVSAYQAFFPFWNSFYRYVEEFLAALGRAVMTDPAAQAVLVISAAAIVIGILYGAFRAGRPAAPALRVRPGFTIVPRFPTLASRMVLFLSFYLPLIIAAEFSILLEGPTTALLLHFAAISVAIAAGAMIGDSEGSTRYVFYAFPLIPIIRVANLTLPLQLFTPLLQVVVINAVVLVGVATAIRTEPGILSGLRYLPSRSTALEWVLGLGIALPLGFVASQTLQPEPLVNIPSASALIRLALVMIFFVGLPEELVFRAFLQRWLSEISGAIPAILVASVTGAIMVIVWGSALYVYFVFATGIFLGLLFHRTRNLALVTISHGLIEFGIFSYALIFAA